MSSERVVALDQETLDLFALKSKKHRVVYPPPIGNDNAVKVRRILQLIRDFSKKPFEQLRIVDFACGEGVYSIEAALRGAEVKAVDARMERMGHGLKAAERLGLKNLSFEQIDIRNVSSASHGKADVLLFLGILYHLDERDVFPVLKNLYEMCQQFVIIDTRIALHHLANTTQNGKTYAGEQYREHGDADPETLRKGRVTSSIDNTFSFWFTKESLLRLLHDVGFTSVCECHVPIEPFKAPERITLIAFKGEPVKISSYPWLNGKTEDEIKVILESYDQKMARGKLKTAKKNTKKFMRSLAKRTREIGFRIWG